MIPSSQVFNDTDIFVLLLCDVMISTTSHLRKSINRVEKLALQLLTEPHTFALPKNMLPGVEKIESRKGVQYA